MLFISSSYGIVVHSCCLCAHVQVTALVAISIAVVIYARNPVGSSPDIQEKPREALEKV